MKHIIEIDNSNINFKNSFTISKNCKNDIEQIEYFIDDLLLYNKDEVLADNSNIVELRGDKSHFKGIFIVYETIIQEMILQDYSNVICEVQYKNEKNNNIDTLINEYNFVSKNCYIKNKNLCIKFLKVTKH